MDTKLKRYSVILKILAFVLIAASSVCAMLTIIKLENPVNELRGVGNLFKKHYTDTWQYNYDYYEMQSEMNTIFRYKSEQNILNGNTLSQSDIDNEIQYLFDSKRDKIEQSLQNSGIYDITQKMLWDKFQEDYKADIDNVNAVLIQNQLDEFRYSVYKFEQTPNLYYYIDAGGNLLSNNSFESIASSKYSHRQTEYESDRKTIASKGAFAFDEKYIDGMNTKFQKAKRNATDYIIQGAICLFLFLSGFAYLVFAAGKKAASPRGVHHVFVDKIYNEITVLFLFLSGCAIVACGAALIEGLFNVIFLSVLLSSSVLLAVAFILILVRHIKSRTLLKHTLIFTLLSFLYKSVKRLYDAGAPMVKAFLLVAALGLLTAVPFAFIVTLPLALVFTYIQVVKYLAIKNGVRMVKSGIYNQKIEVKGTGELSMLAADINDISAGLSNEVERRLKSERLKTELIVNVSHDIKTPLTSVITYVDLLKKEDIDNENAEKYIDIIAQKSDRLRTLIDDLFDASKAASGNISVNLEEVDLSSLVTQGLGELDDKIKASSLDFKINIPKDKITAYADGKLTWRVLENLLSNALKYSLQNSRVYINVFEDMQNAYIEIKNISALELNIPEDEIVERFKRGDESRSSEGSGLGLDIAKSLMLCQNGQLIIKIDGDLFKAILKIPKKQSEN